MTTEVQHDAEEVARRLLTGVMDPEIPAVSIVDLGIIRHVEASADGCEVSIDITPTWAGCPATARIAEDVASVLRQRFQKVSVRTRLDPPWTSDWITPCGRRQLTEAGIAPPTVIGESRLAVLNNGPRTSAAPPCPSCRSTAVDRISEFGPTACRSLWACRACRIQFEYFKPA